jgi:hypothetical protein
MVDLENITCICLVFCCEASTPHSIVKSILNYQKNNSIESKVDGKPPFSMLIMTPYMVQIDFFPKFLLNFKARTYDFYSTLYMKLYAAFMMKGCFRY